MSKRNAILILVTISVLLLAGFIPLIATIQAVSKTVDCATGGTISGALAAAAPSKPLTITVAGTCTESVTISRDDVTIQGATPSSGIRAPSPGASILTLKAAHRIVLQQLELTGGNTGLFANLGSSFQATSLLFTKQSQLGIGVSGNSVGDLALATIKNSSNFGIVALNGGALNVTKTLVENSGNNGILAANGGSIFVSDTTIDNSTVFGVDALAGGHIALINHVTVKNSGFNGVEAEGGSILIIGSTIENNGGRFDGFGVSALWSGFITIGSGLITANARAGVVAHSGSINIQGRSFSENVTISANGQGGVLAYEGGSVDLQGFTIISSNNGDGLQLMGGSHASIGCASAVLSGCAFIKNNSGNGVSVHDTSVFGAGSGAAIINNNGWGIFCPTGTPGGLFFQLRATVTGNGAGQNNCTVFS